VHHIEDDLYGHLRIIQSPLLLQGLAKSIFEDLVRLIHGFVHEPFHFLWVWKPFAGSFSLLSLALFGILSILSFALFAFSSLSLSIAFAFGIAVTCGGCFQLTLFGGSIPLFLRGGRISFLAFAALPGRLSLSFLTSLLPAPFAHALVRCNVASIRQNSTSPTPCAW